MNTERSLNPCYRVFGLGGRRRPLARPSRQNFAENLTRAQLALGVNKSEFGALLGFSPATIGRWLDAKQEPSFEDKDRLIMALNAVLKERGLGHIAYTVADLYADPTEPKSMGMDIERAMRLLQEVVKKTLKG